MWGAEGGSRSMKVYEATRLAEETCRPRGKEGKSEGRTPPLGVDGVGEAEAAVD